MRIHVLYFAHARTLSGCSGEWLAVPQGIGPADLQALLAARLGADATGFRLAVNESYDMPEALRDGDEVAVLPPVSGGAPLCGPGEVDVAALVRAVTAPEHGAVAVFLGTVRNEFMGRPTARLHYEAYEAMAERELAAVAAAAEARHACRVALYHRTGTLEVGEVSLGVAAGAAHRDAAFAACREVVEEIKRRAPLWKREIAPDGGETWHDEVH